MFLFVTMTGEATYCTATMIVKSTYSKTAVVNGPCAFVDYSGVSCNVDNVSDNLRLIRTRYLPMYS